jgi:DNA-binding transcriptional MerR regulator
MTIGVFSDASLISVKALRNYHELGLLAPALVDARTGYRAYSVAQLADAEIIRRLRHLDVPLRDIARVLASRDATTTAAVLGEHRARMAARLAETERIVDDLQQILDEPESLHPVLVHTRRQRPEPILAVRRRVAMAEVPAFFEDAFARLFSLATARRLTITGPTGGRFGDGEGMGHEEIAAEAYVPVERAETATGDIVADHLPDTDLAVALHVGPYDDMRDTYRSVGVWVAEHDRRVTGPLQELYLFGPGPGVDPATFRTEVGWPITAAPSDQGAQP